MEKNKRNSAGNTSEEDWNQREAQVDRLRDRKKSDWSRRRGTGWRKWDERREYRSSNARWCRAWKAMLVFCPSS